MTKGLLGLVRTVGCLAVFLLTCAGTAAASGGEAHLSSLIWPAVNFSLFVAAVVLLYQRYGSGKLAQRARDIVESMKAASEELAEAEAKRDGLAKRWEAIDEERSALLEQYRTEGKKAAQKILHEAEQAVGALQRETARRIQGEYELARRGLRQEMVLLASQHARLRLQNELSADEDRGLRQEALETFLASE